MGKPDAIFYSHHPQLGRDWAQTQSRREMMFIVPPKCQGFQGMVWRATRVGTQHQDPSRPVEDYIGFIGWHLRKRSSKFMEIYGALWMFMDVYGCLWCFTDRKRSSKLLRT